MSLKITLWSEFYKMSVLEVHIGILIADFHGLFTVYFFKKILQLYGPEAPFTVHLIAMRGERILFLKDCDCDRNNSKVKHNHSAESHH